MSDEAIAIIGASCRFPGAADIEAFWELLSAGRDAVTEIDPSRWSTRLFRHPSRTEPGKSYTWSAGMLGGVDLFEPAFFGISPREAAQMDPQQRVLLELVWHAAEDAGIPPGRLAGSATGVYIGASTTDYRDIRTGDPSGSDSYTMTGSSLSIIANRISYIYDLRGPSFTVDTACSSSLVALHEACEAIRAGRIAGAVVGGVNLLLSPYPFVGFCRAAMLSPRGRCFAFDERADGYVRGEGGGIVILKPLKQALADGNRIRAVIRGSGVNSDGRTIGLSLPSQAAQTELLRAVYRQAGIAPDELSFFEMHGTGTPAGDPIEAASVGAALGGGRSTPLPIGSVKTNIGHLEAASGMAGLIKAALALEHGIVPPSLNCATPNPKIPFAALNLRLLHSGEALPAGRRHIAGVNSFGFGGTNAHVVLAAPPPPQARPAAGETLPPLLVSARSEAALRALVGDWRGRLAAMPDAAAAPLLRAAARRREQHPHRLVAIAGDRTELAARLGEFLAGDAEAAVAGNAVRDGGLAFVYSGNGAQFAGMGRFAYEASAGFRDAAGAVDDLMRPLLGWSVAEAIRDGVEPDLLARADVAQPLLFTVQIGIVTVLRRLGVAASGHVGHSVGEIAAAWGAGALSLADAVRVVVARSRNQERTRGLGRMAALALGGEAARELLAELGSPLEIGAFNASQSITVSGPDAALRRLGEEAHRRGVAFRALDLDFAFHSAAMDAIRGSLADDLAGLASSPPSSLLVSTVTGAPVAGERLDAEYWWRNVRSPVRFVEAMAHLIASGQRIFVEIGPSPILQAYLHDGLRAGETQGRVLASLSRRDSVGDPFPALAAQCHVAGHDLSAAPWFDGPDEPRGLPLYPWQRERFWFEQTVEGPDVINPQFAHPLLGYRQHGPAPGWFNHLDPETLPWLADHAVEGVPVFPAAAIIEMALATARVRRPDARALEIVDLELRRPLPFDRGSGRELRAVLVGDDGDWELSSRPRLSHEAPTVHAVARIATAGETHAAPPTLPSGAVLHDIDAETLYRIAARLGLDYGPAFRTVRRIALFAGDAAVVELDPAAVADPLELYLLHPALLDGALQGLLARLALDRPELRGVSFLPWRFGRVRLAAPFGRVPVRAALRVTRIGTRSAASDIALFDAAGVVVAECEECWFRRVELRGGGAIEDRALHVALVPAPLAAAAAPEGLAARVAAHAAAHRGGEEAAAERALLLDALVAAVVERAVRDLVPEGTFTVETLIAAGRAAPEAAVLLDAELQLLARFGAASEGGGEWRLEAAGDLPESGELWRLLLAEAPELVAELALVAAAAEELPRLFADGPRPPEPVSPMVEHLLYASPVSAVGIAFAAAALGDIAVAWPAGRPLRILELGAGGVATRRMLDRLAQSGTAFSYLATSPDADAAARLGFAVSGVGSAAALRWSPGDDGDAFEPGSVDVVLALNAGIAVPLDAAALARLREMLVPGGLFLAVEPEPNPLWELVFGRHAAWWERRAPLRLAADWCGELAAAGFAAADAAVLAAGPWPLAAIWATAPAAEPIPARLPMPPGLTVIAADPGWAEGLARAGHRVGRGREALAEQEDGAVVFAADGADGTDPAAGAAALLAALAPVAAAAAERRLKLFVVTEAAQQGGDDDRGLVGAAVWGFARVLVNETMPRLALRLVDLAPELNPAARVRALAAELAASGEEGEVVWTAAGRHVLRLRRGLPPRWAAAADVLALASDHPGALDALYWKPAPLRPPGPGEVEIEVAAAGLNFRDMMWALGLLPEEALIDGFAGPNFGLECAGTVRALGPGVEELAIGDRVAGFAPAALAGRVTTASHALTRLPDGLDFAAAATVPVAFVTAIYALGTLGQLAPGETVLIHAAAGGVGLAAIQYAKHRGAVVIATAGSELKRGFLRLAGADHVLDSRDLGFADAVRAIAGSGVDVVLNSLSGEAMEASLAVLRPFGRFLELGKRDFYLNRRMHMRPLRQNISYFAIDVDQLPVRRPDLARSLLATVYEALSEGAIRPLAHRVFAFAEIGEAFRLMQASGHIGKLVLVPDGNRAVRLRQPPPLAISAEGTYLVTGGISGFGFAAARWLAGRGVRSLALLGRRGADTPDAAARVAELAALGATARLYAGDVADPASLVAVLDRIRAGQPALRGIVHAASTVADGLAAETEERAAAAILRPKLAGALALDRLTRGDPIELFLLFSSATTLLGAPGQGVYVAANMALEALARRRRGEGLPALAVAWGPIADAGYLANRPDTREALARRLGARPIPAAEALAGLDAAAASGLPVVALAETSWSEARRFLPILAMPLFAELGRDAAASATDDSVLARLAELDGEAALALLRSVVAEEAANILRLPAAGIDAQRPLSELGMDSLMAVELRLALENRLHVDLPLVSLAEGTSVASIAARLAGALSARPQDSELVGLAARYEVAEDEAIAAMAEVLDEFEPAPARSAAAE